MPNAVTTKESRNGAKRKGPPSKNGPTKDSKKPKIDSGLKSAMKTKPKPRAVKMKELSISDDSDSDDADGGAPLYNKASAKSEDLDESDTSEGDEEATPDEGNGLHPDRAKAVVVNSKDQQVAKQPDGLELTEHRPIIEGGTCKAKAIGPRAKGCQTTGR